MESSIRRNRYHAAAILLTLWGVTMSIYWMWSAWVYYEVHLSYLRFIVLFITLPFVLAVIIEGLLASRLYNEMKSKGKSKSRTFFG
jgi:hypothetical protein